VPNTEITIKICLLGGGIQAKVTDRTSHYFGGYYHVRIQVTAEIPVSETAFSDSAEYQDAVKRFGTFVSFSRTLEKMAVPKTEIETVRRHLMESFDKNVLPYLLRDGFADSFVLKEYHKTLNATVSFYRQTS
jgi:hypothetical protein